MNFHDKDYREYNGFGIRDLFDDYTRIIVS